MQKPQQQQQDSLQDNSGSLTVIIKTATITTKAIKTLKITISDMTPKTTATTTTIIIIIIIITTEVIVEKNTLVVVDYFFTGKKIFDVVIIIIITN